MRELWEQSCPQSEDKLGVGVTHAHSPAQPHGTDHGGQVLARGLSAAPSVVCDEPGPSRESHQETQLHGRPTTRPETGTRTPKPSRAAVGLSGRGCGGSQLRPIREIKAC